MRRRHRATFLPQVWDALTDAGDFLGQLKRKAGLPPDFWSDEIRTLSVSGRKVARAGTRAGGAVMSEDHRANYWRRTDDGRMQCDVCPRDCRLHEGQRGACFVRMREGDRDGADDLWAFVGLLHRSDREEAAQSFLPGLKRAVVRHRRLQPRLQVLPELGHQQDRATWTAWPTRPRPEAIAAGAAQARLPERRLHLQRSGDLSPNTRWM